LIVEFVLEPVAYFLLVSSAQAAAPLRPFGTSTKNHITSVAERQTENRNEKPIQLLPVLSIRAMRMMGKIMDDALLQTPRRPKNYKKISEWELDTK